MINEEDDYSDEELNATKTEKVFGTTAFSDG